MAGLTAYVVAKIAGLLYQPTTLRPFELMGVEAGASFLNNPGFPSDHALFTMAIVLAIFNAFIHSRDAYAVVPAGVILSTLVVVLLLLANVQLALRLPVAGGAIR